MKKLITFAAVLLVIAGMSQSAFAHGERELTVGTLMAHTGPLKEYGPNIKNGAALAARQLTEAGLYVELIHEDSETSAIPGQNAARKLVELDGAVAIIGALSSGVTVPIAEAVTSPGGVILISPASTSPLITALPADQNRDYLFRTCPSDALQGVVAGKVAAQKYKTMSILYVNNPYGQGLTQFFTESYEKNGGKIIASVPHDEKAAESYNAELKKALAGNPEALAAYSYPEHAKIYLKEAIEFFDYKSFFFCDGTKSVDLIDALGASNLEGLIGTAPGTLGGKSTALFLAAFESVFGEKPPLPFIDNAYDGMAIIGLAALAAREKGQALTAENIRDQMRGVANPPGTIILPGEFKKALDLLKQGKQINYEGAAGAVDFDENGDVVTPIEVFKYSKGTMETVEVFK